MPGHVIFAVEADPLGRSSLSPIATHLRNAGYDVLVSGNVSQAVGLVFVNRRIEAVLINSYGVRMTGVQVAARLRAINPRIPILLVEANPDGQSSAPDTQKSVCSAIAKLEQLWQGRRQKGSQGCQSGEFHEGDFAFGEVAMEG